MKIEKNKKVQKLFGENNYSQLTLTERNEHTATITHLQTLRKYRNQGYATELLGETMKKIKADGISFVKVKIYPLDENYDGLDRKGLIRLFNGYGFLNLSKYSMILELY